MIPAPLRKLLEIRPSALAAAQRGFVPGEPAMRGRLTKILESFIQGYNLALSIDDPERLVASLHSRFDNHHVGFAFEGVGMYLGLRDLMAPWQSNRPSRLRAFIEGPGRDHDYIIAVGAGFAVARLPWGLRSWPSYSRRLDPLIAWCLPDGYGFQQGFFHPQRTLDGRAPVPAALPASFHQPYDSGIGRSLWWSQCAEPRLIARAIGGFPAARQAEMWCGIGVAAAYAGGVSDSALFELRDLAGPYRADFLSGIPFATRMRQRGRNPSPVTDHACELLLHRSADEAGDWIAATVERIAADDSVPREVRARDVYPLVRRSLVEELSPIAQGVLT